MKSAGMNALMVGDFRLSLGLAAVDVIISKVASILVKAAEPEPAPPAVAP
jgi:hypothetical protein